MKLDEFALIRQIKGWVKNEDPDVLVGIGDDAAVVKLGGSKVLVTTDAFVEGRHFIKGVLKPGEIGWKSVAINLSDIAAMGGRPRFLTVSLLLTGNEREEWIECVFRGIQDVAQEYSVSVVGGNISKAQECVIDVTVIGEASERTFLRSGAKDGDLVAVTGGLGRSAAGLIALEKCGIEAREDFPTLTERHVKPTPRVREALLLSRSSWIHAAIDISDGLSSELNHVASASGVKIEVIAEKLPVEESLVQLGEKLKGDPREWILHGGEEYELLLTFSPEHEGLIREELAKVECPLFTIGNVIKGQGVNLSIGGKMSNLPPNGWNHFRED